MDSFRRDYNYGSQNQTRANALAVGLQQLGALVGCFCAWPITARWGRQKSLVLFSLIFAIGAAIQTIDTGALSAFYVARVIAGLGLGSATVVVPMYNSEMTPKELRGQIGSFFQFFYTIVRSPYQFIIDRICETDFESKGIFTSYWIDYGVLFMSGDPTSQWQIPIGLQILPAAALGLGVLTVKESTRWLTKVGRHDEAWESLKWIRADESPATVEEMEEIRLGVEFENRATEGFQLSGL